MEGNEKKILVVFGSLERAGAQLRTLDVCRKLRQQYPVHIDFCILGLGPNQLESEIKDIQGNIHYISIRSFRFIDNFLQLLRDEQYDVVHSMPLLLSGLIVYLAKGQNVPIRIANFRNSLHYTNAMMANPLFVWFMRSLIKKNATHVVSVSRTALDDVFPPKRQSSIDCRVIYNGITVLPFQVPIDRAKVRKQFGWPVDCKIVINVARFSQQKNHRTILETINKLKCERGNVKLLLVGDYTACDDISDLIKQYGLDDICFMAGIRKDIPKLLLASDVFFFPSLWEGLPGALLEALAAGLPVVASDIPPIKEIKEYFPNAISTAFPNDIEKHIKHILLALDKPTDRVSAQDRFSNAPFCLERAVQDYIVLYDLNEDKNEQ